MEKISASILAKAIRQTSIYVTVEVGLGKWENITAEKLASYIEQQQERIITLAVAVADKLEKGELK